MTDSTTRRWSIDLIAQLTQRRVESARPASVLVMKWSALGDVALASTVIEDISRAFPDAEIDLDTPPRFASFFKHDPRFHHLLGIDTRKGNGAGLLRWLRDVRRARYDAIIDFQSTDRSRLLLAALVLSGGAPRIRIGNHRRWPYTVAPPQQSAQVHALEHLRATLHACGLRTDSVHPVLHPSPDNVANAAGLCAHYLQQGQRYALFMPGCQPAGRLKRWEWRNFAALALAMAQRGVERIFVVGTEDEREECDAIAQACPAVVVNLCGRTSILDIVPLAAGADCVVSNDTGTAHVAAAAARPMVIVCGPTDPRRVKPAGDKVATLQADLWCKNCYRKQCAHHSCMSVLSPELVLSALDRFGVFRNRPVTLPS